MSRLITLNKYLQPYLSVYPLQSRIHLLKTFGDNITPCYVKRDDELNFSISGSKLRKYASLIPQLIAQQIEEAIVIGGAYSNNVVGISQLLIQNGITPHLFLLNNNHNKLLGNLLLTQLLVSTQQIRWLNKSDWPQANQLAQNYSAQSKKKCLVILEGAYMPAVLPGALTLAIDILRNQEQLQQPLQHVLIDAGTGLTAIATILAFSWLETSIKVHVLLLADTENIFLNKLKEYKKFFEQLLNIELDWDKILLQFELHVPKQAKAFGAINKTVWQTILHVARNEGFFIDPIYTSKLFLTARQLLNTNYLRGNTLILHSGGALTLMGFQTQLAKLL